MKIEFVNHTSTILSYDFINIINAPWIMGRVFRNGWSLITKTKFFDLMGLKKTDKKDRSPNFELSSEVLDYCLNFYWGFETTKVNGRFDTVRDRDFLLFSYYSFINSSINHKASINTIINKVKHLIMK